MIERPFYTKKISPFIDMHELNFSRDGIIHMPIYDYLLKALPSLMENPLSHNGR